jgi:hypothetical protein
MYSILNSIFFKIITDKPSPPTGPLMTSDNSETSFILSWNPCKNDGNSPILEYIAEKKENGKKVWQKVIKKKFSFHLNSYLSSHSNLLFN